MLQLRSILTAFCTATVGVLLATFPAAAQQSSSLESLPLATQDEIGQVCLPVQFREGASAYRNCVQSELDLRTGGGKTELGQLSFDDKYAVQQACAKAGGQSSENYRACVSNQIRELNQIPAPSLSQLSEDELYVVQQTCFNAQSKEGAASYRLCMRDEAQSLVNIPAVDTSNLNMLNKNALQLRCSSNSTDVVQYRRCVAAEFESIAGVKPTFLSSEPTSTTNQQVATAENLDINNDNVGDVAALSNESESIEAEVLEQAALEPTVQEAAELGRTVQEPAGLESTVQAPSGLESTVQAPAGLEPTVQEAAVAVTEPAETTTAETTDVAVLNSEPTTTEAVTSMPRYRTQPIESATLDQTNAELSEQGQDTDLATQTLDTNGSNNPASASQFSEATNDIVSTNTQENSSDEDARVISRPDLVEILEIQAQDDAQSTQLEPETGTDINSSDSPGAEPSNAQPLEKIQALWQQTLDKLSTMDAIGWLLIAAVLALPALLLGLFSMAKGLKRSPPAEPEYTPMPDYQAEPGIDSRRLRHEQDAATLFDDEVDTEHDAVTRIATKGEQQRVAQYQADADQWQSAFGDWLLQQPEDSRNGSVY